MEVEAACQEVFMRAFKASARQAYKPARRSANFLFRIARNWRIDTFRKRRPEVSFDAAVALGVEVEDEAPLVEERMMDAEVEALVTDSPAGLPVRDRNDFHGQLCGGHTQTRAAAALGLTRIQDQRIEARVKTGRCPACGRMVTHPRRGGLCDPRRRSSELRTALVGPNGRPAGRRARRDARRWGARPCGGGRRMCRDVARGVRAPGGARATA